MVRLVDALRPPCIKVASGDEELDVTNMMFSDAFLRFKWKGLFMVVVEWPLAPLSLYLQHPCAAVH